MMTDAIRGATAHDYAVCMPVLFRQLGLDDPTPSAERFELGRAFPIVEYRAKVKLHGSNCAVQITEGGIVTQSRTALLTPESDYKGFATWAKAHEA